MESFAISTIRDYTQIERNIINVRTKWENKDMITITATQLKNSLGSYLDEAKNGQTIIVTKDGKEICEIRPRAETKLALFDSLIGIAKGVDAEKAKEERISKL